MAEDGHLARQEPEERTRTQIKEDLKLKMSDPELDKRLKQLVYADILAQGGSNFHFHGLGDLAEPLAALLREAGIGIVDPVRLARYEVSS